MQIQKCACKLMACNFRISATRNFKHDVLSLTNVFNEFLVYYLLAEIDCFNSSSFHCTVALKDLRRVSKVYRGKYKYKISMKVRYIFKMSHYLFIWL